MAVLYVEETGSRLDFIQNMEYKFVELLSIQFNVASDEMLRRKIMFRYLEMKVVPFFSSFPSFHNFLLLTVVESVLGGETKARRITDNC